MVKAGLAEVYRGTPAKGQNMEPYWKAEEEARKAGRGMWVLGDKYVTRGIGERRNPDYSECNGWEDTEETDA
jgi:endonuclease YncB( thermonuclease family)